MIGRHLATPVEPEEYFAVRPITADEYVRKVFWHTNMVESYFAILKRGMYGSFIVSAKHT
jgi:hypothetical protein